ncbi:hypothetical protein ACSBR1_006707 [Camellia fascicularis]
MSALETALHWLRPLVESNTWDYCVVWKLGNDPSRFIQWVGCCCAGACACGGELVNVKEESGHQKHQLFPLCRDCKIKHSAKTKACEKLSHFPSSMALYSGIHGEVVMSTEARWIRCAKDSNSSDHLHESTGTELLIPVVNGLIELFSTKHMDRASILGDAIEYIEDLQKAVKKLQDELRETEKEKLNEESDELEMPKLNATAEHNQDPSTVDENEQMEVQVEVKQIGMRNFLLKLLCKRKQGGFRGLIEAVNSLGLQVIDANVTTFNGKVLNILQVEVNKLGVEVQQKSLRDSLIKLTGNNKTSQEYTMECP